MLPLAWLLTLGVLTTVCAQETLPQGFPTRRGVLAFCPASTLALGRPEDDDIAWLSRFDAIVTNGYGPASELTRRHLQSGGTRLFLYFWTSGFVASELAADLPDGSWRDSLLREHADWLLCGEPTEGPPGSSAAYYFDLANPALRGYLVGMLVRFRAQTGYDGIFFDYAGAMGLGPQASAQWQERHPELPYDRAVLSLLEHLRRTDPQVVIATNQAFRSDEPTAAEADYDLAESYATSFAWGTERTVGQSTLI